eukprot:2452957-Pleurochrysis_carterae.AAC.1
MRGETSVGKEHRSGIGSAVPYPVIKLCRPFSPRREPVDRRQLFTVGFVLSQFAPQNVSFQPSTSRGADWRARKSATSARSPTAVPILVGGSYAQAIYIAELAAALLRPSFAGLVYSQKTTLLPALAPSRFSAIALDCLSTAHTEERAAIATKELSRAKSSSYVDHVPRIQAN